MSMKMEDDITRRIAKRKSAPMLDGIQGETTVAAVSLQKLIRERALHNAVATIDREKALPEQIYSGVWEGFEFRVKR